VPIQLKNFTPVGTAIRNDRKAKNGRAMMYTSGWPKNQNRCCHRMAPPFPASKMCAPTRRSASYPSILLK